MHDYLLGGAHNFAVDRRHAEGVLAALPSARIMAYASRGFLARVVRWAIGRGITQYLVLGSPVALVGSAHQVALRLCPTARVAYVDSDPVAVAHARELLEAPHDSLPNVSVSLADFASPREVMTDLALNAAIDPERPLGLLAISVLPLVVGELAGIVAGYRDGLVAGSAIAISHPVATGDEPTLRAELERLRVLFERSGSPFSVRDLAALQCAMSGLQLVRPGLVDVNDWPVQISGQRSSVYGGVGLVQ